MVKTKGYDIIVLRFIDFIEGLDLVASITAENMYDISDLLRKCLCLGLDLPLVEEPNPHDVYKKACSKYIFEGLRVNKLTPNERQALLEACLQLFYKIIVDGEYI